MPTSATCTYCGQGKTDCPECHRSIHVSELTDGGCTFCAPLLCPICYTRALKVSGCLCGASHGREDMPLLPAVQDIQVEIDLPQIEPLAAGVCAGGDALPGLTPLAAR